MESITRTAYSGLLQTCMLLRRPYPVYPNTTLNEKLNIRKEDKLGVGVYPYLGFLAIGNGGHKLGLGADSLLAPDPHQQEPTNASPFKMIPFVLREITDDLDAVQRARYALRREEEYGGVRYYAYYLKRMDLSNVNPKLEYIVIDGENKSVSDYVPDASVLNPQPRELSPVGVNTTDGDYISSTAKVPIIFTKEDMTELRNMAKIKFGHEKYAIISEIAPVTAVDKDVDSPAPGNSTIPFKEAICAQVASYISSFVAAKFSQSGYDIMLDAGTTEPLFQMGAPE